MNIDVRIKKVRKSAIIPEYKTSGAAALDLHSALELPICVPPRGRAMIPTGIAIAPEDGSVVSIVCARSGLASRHGIALSNGIGVIDSDYRGEIMVSVCNLSDEAYEIKPGERIAQLMFMPVLSASLIEVSELDETARGDGGFGSTGK